MNKNLLVLVMLLVLSIVGKSQVSVTHFLGIPVDGTKAEMVQKLKAKGFTNDPEDKELLKGRFNGVEVQISIVTNREGKVWRIMVFDAFGRSAGEIKIRFNNLCQQFANKKQYIPISAIDYTLSEDEDIFYEMTVNGKRYEAGYYQIQSVESSSSSSATEVTVKELLELADQKCSDSKRCVWFRIAEILGEYYICMYYDNEYNSDADGDDL